MIFRGQHSKKWCFSAYSKHFKGVVGVNETSAEENFSIFLELSWERKLVRMNQSYFLFVVRRRQCKRTQQIQTTTYLLGNNFS